VRFVVTGGCGYIGAAVVRALVERGDHVLNIDSRRKSLPTPALAAIAGREGHVRLESTIKDATLLRALLHEFKPDRIIHLASSSETQPAALFEVEIATTTAILNAAREYATRLEPSARSAFRLVQAVHLPRPVDQPAHDQPHARTLAQRAMEGLVTNWCRANDLPLVTCMADEVFGPWQAEGALLPSLLSEVLAGRPFSLPAGGMTVRDFLPVTDFAQGVLLAAERGAPFACYELSAGTERRDLDVAEACCAILDKRRPRAAGSWSQLVARSGRAPTDGFSPMLDPGPAERDLGWSAGSFYDGLARVAAWAISRSEPAAAPAVALPSAAE
jgi:dTDP-glucose 4,6-dehydratase